MKLEIETNRLNAEELHQWTQDFSACDAFAFWYRDNINGNAIVKDAIVGNIEHAYIYDPDKDLTIDATLGQFDGKFGLEVPDGAAWSGDEHPHVGDDEIYEWRSREAFKEHYDGARNDVSYVVV
jgi:hypothetical protein